MAQTNYPSVPATAKSTLVTVTPIAVILAQTNSFRDSYIITNVGDVPVYLNYGPECDNVVYVFELKPKAIISDNFAGIVSGCTVSDTGYVVVTEKL